MALLKKLINALLRKQITPFDAFKQLGRYGLTIAQRII